MDQDLYQHFKSLFDATSAMKENENKIYEEYSQLEQVPPAPGRPDRAHDTMVEKGILILQKL